MASNESTLVQVALDLDASMDVAGQILPVAALAGGGASATALELRSTAPIEVPPTPFQRLLRTLHPRRSRFLAITCP